MVEDEKRSTINYHFLFLFKGMSTYKYSPLDMDVIERSIFWYVPITIIATGYVIKH